jgi:predicted transcriptional regulator
MKLCSRKRDQVRIDLVGQEQRKIESDFQYMPIGHYTDCGITPTCGMAGSQSNIGSQDDTATFYEPEHFDAQLLWFQKGYVEYRFSSRQAVNRKLHCMEISFEACSEAPNYRLDWPSDITVWINGKELGTWRCPGDFGGRQGRCTPIWWPRSATQYGIVKRWRVDHTGCRLDDERISDVTLAQLRLADQPYITLRIGIKEEAEQHGGINLFGEQFGDYNQAIILRLDTVSESADEGSNTP